MPLRVLLNNRLVGHLQKEADGAIFFRYAESWLSWLSGMQISTAIMCIKHLSLPFKALQDRKVNGPFLDFWVMRLAGRMLQ